jgi:Zn-finger protein
VRKRCVEGWKEGAGMTTAGTNNRDGKGIQEKEGNEVNVCSIYCWNEHASSSIKDVIRKVIVIKVISFNLQHTSGNQTPVSNSNTTYLSGITVP